MGFGVEVAELGVEVGSLCLSRVGGFGLEVGVIRGGEAMVLVVVVGRKVRGRSCFFFSKRVEGRLVDCHVGLIILSVSSLWMRKCPMRC